MITIQRVWKPFKTWLGRNRLWVGFFGAIAILFIAGLLVGFSINRPIEYTSKIRMKFEPLINKEELSTKTPIASISTPEFVVATPIEVISPSSTKSYMSISEITNTTSPQWELIHEQKEVDIQKSGYLMTKDGFYGVALGSYFGDIGERYIFELSSGNFIKAIKIEAKDDAHTCEKGYQALDGSVIEFVIDTTSPEMKANVWSNGLIWQGNFNNNPGFEGEIISIWRITDEK